MKPEQTLLNLEKTIDKQKRIFCPGGRNILLKTTQFRSNSDHIKYIQALLKLMRRDFKHFTLVFNSLDIACYQADLMEVLSELVAPKPEDSCQIRLIASVDSIFAPTIISENNENKFNISWELISTCEDFSKEKTFGKMLFNVRNDINMKGIGYFLESVTKKQV